MEIRKSIAMICIAAAAVACTKSENGNEEKEDFNLKGRVTSDLTLKEGCTYKLLGSLQVVAPARLTIEPGVTVEAADNGEINYILIEQGASISAVGTADSPIVLNFPEMQTEH